ncbi:HK97 family phage prohead protease [Savagea sp. SN6]|uniref:HK97 family phage prohead protease n=1 Tax=Savagea serpentis TaxID=2785297 RepID=A0A8J7KS61_9BACL|nr:HK97 family phage prohead protease [Savagea serpentis]MBF4500229.1 HK97 family phage prohead protease [Savagea serpentis]
MKFEKRELLIEDLSIDKKENSMTVEGYTLKWGSMSNPIATADGFFYENFAMGAFDETLQNDEQLVLYGHDINQVLGRTSNNTALLVADEAGLHLTVDLPNTTLGKDVLELVKRGDIAGMSVGFIKQEDSFERVDGDIVRTINKAKLVEVSLVPMPAYDSSDVSQRSMEGLQDLLEQEQKQKELRQRLLLLAQI